jgi:hypothetical protein
MTFGSILLHMYCTADAIFSQASHHKLLDQLSPNEFERQRQT